MMNEIEGLLESNPLDEWLNETKKLEIVKETCDLCKNCKNSNQKGKCKIKTKPTNQYNYCYKKGYNKYRLEDCINYKRR